MREARLLPSPRVGLLVLKTILSRAGDLRIPLTSSDRPRHLPSKVPTKVLL